MRYWGTSLVRTGPSAVSPTAVALLASTSCPNGQYLIPSCDRQQADATFPENAIIPGTAYFTLRSGRRQSRLEQSTKDTMSVKYYYQHDPSIAPYAYSIVAGFPAAS